MREEDKKRLRKYRKRRAKRIEHRFSDKDVFACPNCKASGPHVRKVEYTRAIVNGPIRRKNECLVCGKIFFSYESTSPQQPDEYDED